MDSMDYQFDKEKGYGIKEFEGKWIVRDRLSRRDTIYNSKQEAIEAYLVNNRKAEVLMEAGSVCDFCKKEPALVTNSNGKPTCLGCYK